MASAPPPPPPPHAPPFVDSDKAIALDMVLVCVGGLLALLVQQWLSMRQWSLLTDAGSGMLLGVVFNLSFFMLWVITPELTYHMRTLALDQSAHDIIYFGLLPPIIFEAGFTMRKRKFFANFSTIMLYAVFGTTIAMLCTGAILWGANEAQLLWTQFTFPQIMMFSALISATDPVATLSTLKHLHATPLLYDLIFGESTLNDALGVVLFSFFRELNEAQGGEDSPDAAAAVGRLVTVVVGSITCGMLIALTSAFITKRLHELPPRQRPKAPAELGMLLLFAVLSYTLGEWLDLSGIMAIFFTGILMRHYTFYNLSAASQKSARTMFITIAGLCETSLAVLLGVAIVDYAVRAFLPVPSLYLPCTFPVPSLYLPHRCAPSSPTTKARPASTMNGTSAGAGGGLRGRRVHRRGRGHDHSVRRTPLRRRR
jgi:sodium/hydrogen exchanger 8